MRINGFSPLPFYSDSLNISADIEPPDAESDVIELQGFFLGLTGQEFISSLVKSIHSQEVMLKMNFHLFNEAMLLYESNSDDITRLFFLKSLDRVSSEITTLDGVIPLQKSVKEIHLTTSSQLSLVIQNNNSSYRYYYSTVKEFLEELKKHLLDKKIFRLISKGKLINMDLITNELIVVLQQNKHNDHDLSIEKDSVIDMAIINDASRFYIERDKDWINGIIANKSTTEPTINKNSSSDNQNNILKGNHTEIDEKMAKILKLPIEDYLALRAAQHFNKYVIETDASLNQFSDPKETLNDWRSYKRIDSGFDNKLKYSRGYATNPSGKEINTTLLYGNHGTENSDLFLLTHNEFFSDFFKANNSDQLEYDHTYISFQNGHAFFDLTDNKLLPIQLDRTKNKFIVNEADFDKTFISEDKHDDTLYKIEAFKRSKTLPIFEITIYDQDEKISKSKTNTKLFILGSTLSSIKPILNNFIETSSGDHRHSLYYGVLDGALLNFVSDNDTLNGAPVIKRLRIKSPNPIIYRTDQLVTHQIGEGEDAEIFTYISDKAIMKNIQSFKTNSSSKYDNNDIYQGPSDLKIIFQLENDPTINESVYKNFSRYPDKTIIVQINNNGDYDIVNGIDNLKEFTRDNSKSNIIFDIQGHGDRFFEGRKTPTTLARIIKNFVDTAPDFMAKKYNDNSNNTPISGSDIFLAPSHFNMSGCSLGAQSEYLLDSLTESLSINYAALAGKDGDMTFQNVSDHKKGLIFWGGSFSEKFIYAYNDIGGKLPKTIEAWSKDTTRDATGELGVYAEFSTKDDLEDAKLYHKVFTIEDGLPKELDNIEYRRNPTTQFIEYRLERNKPFIKIFRGPDFNSSRVTN